VPEARPGARTEPATGLDAGAALDTRADTDAGTTGAGAPEPGGAPRHGGRGRGGRGRGGGGAGRGGRAMGAARNHPVRSAVALFVVVVLGVLTGGVVWYEGQVDPGPAGARTVVTVDDGSSLGAVTADLVRQGVIHSGLAFRLYLALHGTPVVRPGGYLLRKNDSFGALRSALAGGPDVYAVDVLPGFTVSEVAQRVGLVPGHDGAHFLSLLSSGAVRSPYEPAGSTNVDGLLGTGVYLVVPGESDAQLLGAMVDRFDALARRVGLTSGAAALGVTPYQAVTVASIVQKEGVYPKNLGKVARVVYNRLARGKALQMDSTVLYSEHRDGGPVTPADLALNTPYNTYLHAGLTPTPIAFPSQGALQAALHPTPGDWLYFVVVSKDGTEAFSDTLAGQLANERLAQSRGLG